MADWSRLQTYKPIYNEHGTQDFKQTTEQKRE